jgi:hypothetical protein
MIKIIAIVSGDPATHRAFKASVKQAITAGLRCSDPRTPTGDLLWFILLSQQFDDERQRIEDLRIQNGDAKTDAMLASLAIANEAWVQLQA